VVAMVAAMVAANARWCSGRLDSIAIDKMSCHRSGRNRNRGNDVKLVAILLAFAFISGCTTGSAVSFPVKWTTLK
jgi:hypothetical protein